MNKRLLLFLYSTENIVGCLLASFGLVAFFVGIIKAYWLFIVVGLYALGFLLTPKAKFASNLGHENLSVRELQLVLDGLITKISKRVSAEVLTKVVTIKDNIFMILPRLEAMNAGDYDVHVLEQTVLDYLPQMLSTYLELPPVFAKMHKMRNGKTPQEALIEQLSLLDEQIQRILVNVNNKNAEALMAQGEFLKSKFINNDAWL
ncbi:MAG: hypothetical protein WAX77_01995 [Methylococcaceae bacterium]